MNSTTIDLPATARNPAPVQSKPKARIQRTRGQWKALVEEFTIFALFITLVVKANMLVDE